jgi:hypothetical protein
MSTADPFPASSRAARIHHEIRKAIPRLGLAQGKAAGKKALSASLLEELKALSPQELLGGGIARSDMALAVLAGLLLRADCLDDSHKVSQGIPTAEGSYWHAIMHRREPDYENARYWFRRLGEHPVFPRLAGHAWASPRAKAASEAVLRDGKWDPYRFIDLCEACETGARPELREGLEFLQDREVELLLAFCSQGGPGEEGEEEWGGEKER